MITINNEASGLVVAAVIGEFTLNDFNEFENAVEYALKFQGSANLLVDMRDMIGFTVDVAWKEIHFTRQHAHDFERIALVTGSEWQDWSAWLTRLFTNADMQIFEDYAPALDWARGA